MTKKWAEKIAAACKYGWLQVLASGFVFGMIVNCLFAVTEELLFGERFLHWGDFLLWSFIVYMGVKSAFVCAERNSGWRHLARCHEAHKVNKDD